LNAHGPLWQRLEKVEWFKRAQNFYEQGFVTDEVLSAHVLTWRLNEISLKRGKWDNLAKRVFDFSATTLALCVLAPFLALVAILIKANSQGRVFFVQPRMGRNFRVFYIYKFRTMFDDAEQKVTLLQDSRGPLGKSLHDTRSTQLGKFLRRWKIDELPQLINVLQGDMSLVGPRPLTLDDSATCPLHLIERFAVKPGLTGLWQAMVSNSCAGMLKLRLDARYAHQGSFWLDLYLVYRTVFMVLQGEQDLEGPHSARRCAPKPPKKLSA